MSRSKNDLLAYLMEQEDAARSVARRITAGHARHVQSDDVIELARIVARMGQATRDALEAINTSEFRR